MKLFAVLLLIVLAQGENNIAEPASTAAILLSLPTSVTLPTISRSTIKLQESIGTSTGTEKAIVTAPPEWKGVSAIQEKWHLTTYTTCFTLAGSVDCGV
jgi:hypothetical protein